MGLHLLAHPKLQNGKRYCYYTLSESYRQDGKVCKRTVTNLGKLTDEQAELIRLALRVKGDSTYQLLRPKDVDCVNQVDFLDASVFHFLWQQLALLLPKSTGKVSLARLLEILVINRCVNPKSKLGVTRWYSSTALPEILDVESKAIEETRLYRSLPQIAAIQTDIEQQLFKKSKNTSLYFYDLSSSYFEGEEVSLSAFGHSKDHREDRMQVVLGLLINEEGLPFSWEIFKGNQADAPTLKKQLKKFKNRFKIDEATLVFDRGFLSRDNLNRVEAEGYSYVTGLDMPQIETLLSTYPQGWLEKINSDNCEEIVSKQANWQRFDETQFYCPLGIVNDCQTILLFDISRYRLSLLKRQEKIEAFKDWVHKHNLWLSKFKKDAKREAITKDVEAELKKRHLSPYIEYSLREYGAENQTFQRKKDNPYPSQGYMRGVKTFEIEVQEKNSRLLDGVFALVTSKESSLTPEAMIHIYQQKYLIEQAFREMKSVLKLRPWFVYKEEHIKAHYTICVLAYYLERLLDLKLESHGLKEQGWTLPRLKEEMAKIHLVDLSIGKTKKSVVQKIPANLTAVLSKIGLKKTLQIPL